MALLPGDKPDEELRALSTVADALRRAIWSKVGPKFDEFLDLCKGHVGWRRSAGIRAAIAERRGVWCGYFRLGHRAARWTDGALSCRLYSIVLWCRVRVEPVNRLVKSLLRKDEPLPVFVASLKRRRAGTPVHRRHLP
jgi:cobaltochelatase CobN